MDNLILKIDNISKSFPRVKANKNVTFNIKRNTVHALLGENGAGKSTFVKILYGLLKPDEGKIIFNDNVLNVQSPSEARQKKIGMVFQHFSLFDSLTVRENLILGIDNDMSFSDLKKNVNEISERYELPLDLDAPINTLSAGQKQRVEIVRILLQDPELLIMDEPTSVLTPQEVEDLFKTLNTLLKEGRTILYITHKLEEVINLCDEVTILRDGAVIESSKLENETAESLATKMLGKKLSEIKTDYTHIKSKINLKADNLSINFNDPFFTDLKKISFDLREGEIFGIAGVAGNGQSELMNLLTGEGIDDVSGSLIYNEVDIKSFNPKKRRDMSIAFVPENRLGHSAVPELTLTENILISQFPNNNFLNNGMINHRNINLQAKKVIEQFNVVTPGVDAKASSLSGGNLQKFVIGREILTNPKLLIISHPTWGIDAGAEHAIRKSLIELAKNGTSIIVISQDLDELIEISDSFTALVGGRISDPKPMNSLNIRDIGQMMSGAMSYD